MRGPLKPGPLEISIKEITASEFTKDIQTDLAMGADERTKFAALATKGQTLFVTVAADMAKIVSDVKAVAAKPASVSLRNLLKADRIVDKDQHRRADIDTTENAIDSATQGLRVQTTIYFTAVNHFVSDAYAFA